MPSKKQIRASLLLLAVAVGPVPVPGTPFSQFVFFFALKKIGILRESVIRNFIGAKPRDVRKSKFDFTLST